MALIEITWEQIKPLVPKTSLYYVDYRDSLDERLPLLETCMHSGSYETLDDIIMNWDVDIEEYIKETKSNIKTAFPSIDDDKADEIMEEFEDYIRDQIYENDDSTPIDDLIRNTGSKTMFYDTGYEMEGNSWNWNEKRVSQERRGIFKYLGLKTKDQNIIDAVEMMIMQASYGGFLVIYFYENPGNFIMFDTDINSVRFTNFALAIIDTSGGSGDHCYINAKEDISITLPFERERMHICANIKNSYTHNTCGMNSNWCDGTSIALLPKKSKKTLLNSGLSEEQDKDKKYAETYQAGKCTAGDIDIKRHRNVTYINNYPCGNKCLDCGTFWID